MRIISAAVAVAVAAACMTACGGAKAESVSLNDYVEFTVSGYDGYGTISYEFNTVSFVNDYADKVAFVSETGTEAPSATAAQSLAQHVADAGEFTKTEGLSNGDRTIFSWTFNRAELENMFAVSLAYSDIPCDISSLNDVHSVDIFDEINVTFGGTSPQGTATVVTKDSAYGLTSSDFILSKSTWLSNGETVTVTLSESGLERLAENEGMVPSAESHEYTVEGIPYYASDVSQIPEDSLKTAWTRIQDNYTETLNVEMENSQSAWGHNLRKFVSMNYAGYYFFVNKNTGFNMLMFVFEIDSYRSEVTENGTELTSPVKYYWFAYYPDVIIDRDGKWVVPSEYPDLTELFGEDEASFTLESQYRVLGTIYSDEIVYTGYQYLDEMMKDIEELLPEYTLVNDTVSGQTEETPAEEQPAEETYENPAEEEPAG